MDALNVGVVANTGDRKHLVGFTVQTTLEAGPP